MQHKTIICEIFFLACVMFCDVVPLKYLGKTKVSG